MKWWRLLRNQIKSCHKAFSKTCGDETAVHPVWFTPPHFLLTRVREAQSATCIEAEREQTAADQRQTKEMKTWLLHNYECSPPIPRGALISCSVWYNKVWMMPSARHAKSYTVTVSHLIGLATGCCCCCLCCCWGNHGHSEKPGDEERRNNKGMSVMLFRTNTDKQRIVCMRLFCNAHVFCETPTQ